FSVPDLLVHLGGEPAVFGRGKRFLVQDIDDLVGGGTVPGFFGQTAGQQVIQSTFGQRTQIGFLVDDAVQNVGRRTLPERWHATGCVYHDTGEGEDVALRGLRPAQDRFRCGVGRGAEGLTGLGENRATDG